MTDNALILSNSALSVYQDRDDVRELGDRLMAMHPAAGEVGAATMRAAAQLALLLGANPLPGVNEIHIWKDNKGRPCVSLGINYWRRKGQEWGGYLYEIPPRPMRAQELAAYGIPENTIAAICRGVRTDEMVRFKALGFTTREIWDMCGRTGIGTQGPNEYAKSGRPSTWTSLKRAETDMLRQLFPAEFGTVDRQLADSTLPVEIDVIDAPAVEKPVYTLDDLNADLGFDVSPAPRADAPDEIDDGDYEDEPPNPTGRLYADGSFVAEAAAASYDAYVEAHGGDAPENVHNLRNWYKKQQRNGAPAAQAAQLFEMEPTPAALGAYQE